ncbi:MAG: hypothetical protein QOE77_2018 [Blastocatellia bacterium]|nr:hypothetical protein [Blastocatellia bacterium]
MPADYYLKLSRRRPHIHLIQVMHHVYKDCSDFYDFPMRDIFRPCTLVIISSNCDDRGNGLQVFEHSGITDVTCMEYELQTSKRINGFRADQAVSVRNNSDQSFHHVPNYGLILYLISTDILSDAYSQ